MALFKPNKILQRITDINPAMLEKLNIKTLLVDVDNTLSTHHGTVLVDGLPEWIAATKEKGIDLIIVSNSKHYRIEPFAQRVGLPFVSLALKPLPFGYRKAIKQQKADKKSSAIVGDQIFTDVLGANLYGIKSILVRPIKLEDGWSFKVRRFFERKLLKDKF